MYANTFCEEITFNITGYRDPQHNCFLALFYLHLRVRFLGRSAGRLCSRYIGSEADSLELLRMSVDRHCRKYGVGAALGRTVLEFACQCAHTASSSASFSVILGTTAYTPTAHRLYQSLSF